MGARDDTGRPVDVPAQVRRVVSLVPSLTEAVAVSAPGLLVGATEWCTHPADLDVTRVRGTKNPDVEAIASLRPDLVVANAEENRAADLESLRSRGIPVWVTDVRTVPGAFDSLTRMLAVCGVGQPRWLADAREAWRAPYDGPRRRAVVPIWRRPWMVLGSDTFAGDVLARLGCDNALADHAERYPRLSLEELRAVDADLVVLPDEPYAFAADDGPECFPQPDVALVSGRHLTWYGPSLLEARSVLATQLAAARAGAQW